MRKPQSAASAVAGIGALLVAGVFIAACALADRASIAAGAAPLLPNEMSQHATRSDTVPSTAFITQNGTMRLRLPDGWTVADSSTQGQNYAGQPQWSNVLLLTSPYAPALRYYDGHGEATATRWLDFEVVDVRETPSGHLAIAYWRETANGVIADVVLGWLGPSGQPMEHTMLSGIGRTHAMGMRFALESGPPRFQSADAARAFLAAPPAQEALALIATVELLPVPQGAMPDGAAAAAPGRIP